VAFRVSDFTLTSDPGPPQMSSIRRSSRPRAKQKDNDEQQVVPSKCAERKVSLSNPETGLYPKTGRRGAPQVNALNGSYLLSLLRMPGNSLERVKYPFTNLGVCLLLAL